MLLGTLSHLTDNTQAVNAFTCIAAHLRPGGVLLLEVAHPGGAVSGGTSGTQEACPRGGPWGRATSAPGQGRPWG